jgi:5-methylcytosine-specific restriction endonuclease McrA
MQPFETDAQRTVQRHEDSMGNTCPLSGRVGPDWDERSTRAAVPGRSGGSCEYCALARAQDMAHRRATGVGGRWSPANVLHLCRRCHRRAHDYPQWAHAVGLRLKQGENPEKRLVTRENGTAFQPTDEIAMPRSKGR